MRKRNRHTLLAGLLAAGASPILSAQEPEAQSALIDAAFERAKSASGAIEIEGISCTRDQRQIVELRGAELQFPCMLQELIQDADDASMVVTLLLAEAPPVPQQVFTKDRSIADTAAAVGIAVAGAQLDPDTDAKRIERFEREDERAPITPLATYLPRNSDTYRAEVARVDTQIGDRRTDQRASERMQERAAEERAEALQRQARYQSVTDFMNLANAQDFCVADGRAILARAIEYSTSPLVQDRMVGLWADDRRHALEAYLNDVSRCV